MDCPLCAASNEDSAVVCYLCGSNLKKSLQEEVLTSDDKKSGFKIRKLNIYGRRPIIFAILFVVAIITWFQLSPFLSKPHDVLTSRESFQKLKEKYYANEDTWDQQKDQILNTMIGHRAVSPIYKETISFENIPLEVVMAFLFQDLDFSSPQFSSTTFYLSPDLSTPTVIISKYDTFVWPLKSLLSLELKFDVNNKKLHVDFSKLRSGTKEISSDLAWAYFTPELQALRYFEMFLGGITDVSFSHNEEPEENISQASPITISWDYMHQPIFNY